MQQPRNLTAAGLYVCAWVSMNEIWPVARPHTFELSDDDDGRRGQRRRAVPRHQEPESN